MYRSVSLFQGIDHPRPETMGGAPMGRSAPGGCVGAPAGRKAGRLVRYCLKRNRNVRLALAWSRV